MKTSRTAFRDEKDSRSMKGSVVEAIGNTPLIKLERVSAATGCTILGKAEFMNPGQSVKDRAALFIIEDAVKQRRAAPGGVIVEGTAGNTGIGLALVGNAMGFRSRDRHPGNPEPGKEGHAAAVRRRTGRGAGRALFQSQQLRESLRPARRATGARPKRTARSGPTSSTTSPIARAISRPPARKSGSRPTARSTASSAPSAPAARSPASRIALKARNKAVRIALADPMGAALYSYYTTGMLKSEGSSITEGIGQGRITKNLEGAPIDIAYQIPDDEAVPIIFDLLEHEGLCLGGSSGINVAGAVRLARELGPGHTIVTMLADYGTRYQSKLFNPEFLRSKKLPVPAWLERRPEAPDATS